jgi:putative transposase
MKAYRSSSDAVWDCKYHLVWITKYRYPVLIGDVGLRARELLREIAQSLDREPALDGGHPRELTIEI